MVELVLAMSELDEDRVLSLTKEHQSDRDRYSVISQLNQGMLEVGKRFENGDYFLADLIVSGIIYRKALGLIGPLADGKNQKTNGRIMIGVAKNDIHDIGKDIIVSILCADGFEVIDLGTDVSADTFVARAKQERPDLIAICGTMGFAFGEMGLIIEALENAGIRESVSILVGGMCVDQEESLVIGADGYSKDPVDALNICRKLLIGKENV